MNNKILTLYVISFIAGAIFIGCQNPGEKRLQKQNENLVEVKAASKTDKDKYSDEWLAFKKESEIKINLNEDKIAAFKNKMKKSGTKIKAEYAKEISTLEETNKEMKKTLNNYKNDGNKVWIDFKTGFNNAMDKLSNSIDGLFATQD